MKRWAVLMLAGGLCGGVRAMPPEVLFRFDAQPASNGFWAAEAPLVPGFGGGALVSNLNVRSFSSATSPPTLGGSKPISLTATAELYWSSNAGATYSARSAPAAVTLFLSHTNDAGGTQYFSAELQQLDIIGGSLPAGLRLRESPTRASRGLLTVRPVGGQSLQSSLFDVFLELSLNSGGSWSPATTSTTLTLRYDPAALPAVRHPSELIPEPAGGYAAVAATNALLPTPVVLRDFHLRYFTPYLPPPANGVTDYPVFQARALFQLSTNGGASFAAADCTFQLASSCFHRSTNAGGATTYDAEVLTFPLSGGTLPAGLQIRENPLLLSPGGRMHAAAGDAFLIRSFFDVWLEVSVNGGGAWTPVALPVRLAAEEVSPPTVHPSPRYPPFTGDIVSRRDAVALFQSGSLEKDSVTGRFSTNHPLPAVQGAFALLNFDAYNYTKYSIDGGLTYTQFYALAQCAMGATLADSAGGTDFYDTEMLSMFVGGGNLPAPLLARESPTRRSLGRTSVRSVAGGFELVSFFDVFCELSTDYGATWSPADQPLLVEVRRFPALAIVPQGGSNLVTWAAPSTGYFPEFAASPANGAAWSLVTNVVLPIGNADGFLRRPLASNEFYRLSRGP